VRDRERPSEEAVFEAIWGPARARRRRREREIPLSVEDVCRVALELIDADGIDALTMRSLARALDASPSALYWYVHSKEELLDRVRDVISGEMRLLELDVEQEWRAAATDGARRIRAAMLAHPRAAVLIAMRAPVGPNALRGIERLLSVFVRAGFPPDAIAPAFAAYIDYTMAATLRTCLDLERQQTPDSQEPYPLAVLVAQHVSSVAFPHLTTFATELFEGSLDDVFEFGLAQLLIALDAMRATPPPAPRDPAQAR
jgi:AcrR family transcriptional regulator